LIGEGVRGGLVVSGKSVKITAFSLAVQPHPPLPLLRGGGFVIQRTLKIIYKITKLKIKNSQNGQRKIKR
jgi:hypothetical protein